MIAGPSSPWRLDQPRRDGRRRSRSPAWEVTPMSAAISMPSSPSTEAISSRSLSPRTGRSGASRPVSRGGWWCRKTPPRQVELEHPGPVAVVGLGGPGRGRRRRGLTHRTSSATASGSATGGVLAAMKSSPKPATPSTSRRPSPAAWPRRPAGAHLLGQHGHHRGPRGVLAGQQGERVPPAPLGRKRPGTGSAGQVQASAPRRRWAGRGGRGRPAARPRWSPAPAAPAGRRPAGRRPCRRGA